MITSMASSRWSRSSWSEAPPTSGAGLCTSVAATCTERAGLTRDEALALAAQRGGRPDDPDKEDPLDVALWVPSSGDDPAWESPWGLGRPGWHAECTAMALTTFGASVDLHAGGDDLAFPHHAYEAAQAETFTGVRPFARSWMHVGAVRVAGTKMAKSTGNLVFVRDLLERWSAAAIRLLILERPFARPWDFDEAQLDAAAGELESLHSAESRPGGTPAASEEVARALRDNLDVPRRSLWPGRRAGRPWAVW